MKTRLFTEIENGKEHWFDLAWQIYDNPQWDDDTVFACELLTNELKAQGFDVETSVGGLKTSFRAVWKNGEGGANIGFLGEYDSPRNEGHGCGHHMQTPAAIAAATALKNAFAENGTPCTLTIYGTPAEETFGGKIVMAENGCFSELDVALASHASDGDGLVTASGMALSPYVVDFYGKKAHASAAPHEGRSASDAMLLAFHGVEFLREHVKQETRMHYAIREGTGATNVVCDHAVAAFTLRSPDDKYLEEIDLRFRDIIKGACLMTGTTAEITRNRGFSAGKNNVALAECAKENYLACNIPTADNFLVSINGSSDVCNVARIVPAIMCNVFFNKAPAHSKEWIDAGKTDEARECIINSAKLLAGIAYDLITDKDKLAAIKSEHNK